MEADRTLDVGAVHEALKAAIRALNEAWERSASQDEVQPLIAKVQAASTAVLGLTLRSVH